jgi:two-component system nitrate/nitrite response regulator NarL
MYAQRLDPPVHGESLQMRLIICDPHVAFAESLAHVFEGLGMRITAVVQRIPEAAAALSRHPTDVCIVGLGGQELQADDVPRLQALAARVSVVVIVDAISTSLRATCLDAGVQGLTEMRHDIAEFTRVLERVHRGRTALGAVGTSARDQPEELGGAHRLAAFLSAREREVLAALVRGDHTSSIARSMGISTTTARGHVQGVLTKLGTHNRVEAVTLAVRAKLVDPHTGNWLVP